MSQARNLPSLLLPLAAVVCISLLSACSGGGGGGGGGGGPGVLLLVVADGASAPLFANVAGVPTVPSVCPTGVFVNARITFTFDGPVDPSSLPPPGPATGSIEITDPITGLPAEGSFDVEDDPTMPPGNMRRVVFRPTLPGDPAAGCSGGLAQAQVYEISVPSGAAGTVLDVNGEALAQGGDTCFRVCGCPDGAGCITPYEDPIPGPAFVLDTNPATGDPAPAPIVACDIQDDTIRIRVSEPLDPNGIDLANVRVINVATGAQVPGSLVFHQAPNATGNDTVSQIDYVASGNLLSNVTYQIVFGPAVRDLGGNPIQTSASNPSAQLFFQTIPILTYPQPPIDETFDFPNPGQTSGALSWIGDGSLKATFPIEYVGTGADGTLSPAPGTTTVLDTNQIVNGQSRKGVFNYTGVIIPQTATVRIVGPHLAHIRCQGVFVLNGTILATPGEVNPAMATFPYDHGPEAGVINNGGGTNCEASGGVGNAGGGPGGTASGFTPPPGGPPTNQCPFRTNVGENGFGPAIDGVPTTPLTGPGLYGGGQGGDSGCFPAVGAGCTPGDLGGLGGAGGTSARIGEPGVPRTANMACVPFSPVVQPIAQPTQVPPVMIPPIPQQSAGSGGGGGGDHLDANGTPPNNDDQGGGGGGGGGGLRISCGGTYVASGTSQIIARGALGGTAPILGGGGGSGSGGEVWIQSFASLLFTPSALINVDGPGRVGPTIGQVGCSFGAPGGGGDGLVQLEAGVGPPPTLSFNLFPTPTPTNGAVFSSVPFIYAANVVTGHATSGFLYSGFQAPDYATPTEVFSLGNAPATTLTITYRGALEAVDSTPQNPVLDPATLKSMATGGGPITAANIDELDGYPFIAWFVDVSFSGPSVTPANAILPSVESISIPFASGVCP